MSEDIKEMTTDDALLESLSEHTIEDLKLEPFSLLRQSVATSLCDDGGSVLFNAIMTVWVCTLSPDEALEAHRDLIKAKKKAFEWGESRGYSLGNWRPVIDMYNRLNREWSVAARARVKQDQIDSQEPSPNGGGQLEQ